ncbi:MAG: TonB-dependent receptor [Acidobacteriota bacterium]
MHRVWLCLALAAFVSLPVLADGPETGIVEGTVSDGSGAALPGVLVTLSGDRGTKTSVTDGNGSYRFALLVPGNYSLKAELEGFDPVGADVTVVAGNKSVIPLTLRLGTSEEITVTSEAPMVDKFNVTAGSTIQAEVGEQTAGTTRTYYGVINALPGVTADAENDDIQQTRPSVNGTHFADQAVYIDGVDTTFAKFGGSRVFLPTTAVTEVSMEAGGSSAEYGRVIGSSTNVIVKSGTNRFHADFLYQRQEVDWGAEYKNQPSLANREITPFPTDWFVRRPAEEEGGSNGYEFSAGGPIARDKAWFFLGWSDFDDAYQERLLGGDPYDTSLKNEAQILKLNLQPSQAHSLAASYIGTPAFRNYFNQESFDYWTPTPHDVDGELATVNWNWSINSNFFLEAKIASQTSTEDKLLACGSIVIDECLTLKQQDRGPAAGHSATDTSAPSDLPLRFPANPEAGQFWPGNNYFVYRDTNFLSAWHNGWILSDGFGFNEFPRDQANAALTQFVGANHELKWGIDYQATEWRGQNARPGLLDGFNYDSFNQFGYAGAGTLADDTCGLARALDPSLWSTFGRGRICNWVDYNAPFLDDIFFGGDAEMRDTALYVRDRFTVGDHWTFNIGVRAALQEGFNDVRRQVVDDTYVDPRLNVTYDVKGDGKMLFNLSAGHYHAMLNQAWIAGGGDTAAGMHDGWNGYNGREVYLFCDPLDVAAGLCNDVGYNFFFSRIVPGEMWQSVEAGIWDHDLDIYYKEEIILGFEWQFSRNWALDVKYIDWDLEDMMFSNTQLNENGNNIFITANYKNLPNILTSLADAREANGLPRGINQADIDSFQQARNGYRGLQLQVNRRFANGWSLYNNVSWSETDTTGSGSWWNNTQSDYGENLEVILNEGQLAQCQEEQAARTVPVDCFASLGEFLGQPVSTINRRGPNGVYDRSIIWNSFGFKTWQMGPTDFTLGGHFTYQTGTPWARSEGVNAINLDGSNGNNTGVGLVLHERGRRGRRTTNEYTVNLSSALGFKMGGQLRGEFRVEVINVTDQQRQRNFDGRGEVFPVRRFFQRPRQARASFKIAW